MASETSQPSQRDEPARRASETSQRRPSWELLSERYLIIQNTPRALLVFAALSITPRALLVFAALSITTRALLVFAAFGTKQCSGKPVS